MGSPQADTAHADEALKVLFVRFKEAPGSNAFEELAEALLARGHASEALQICEHGLQIHPAHANGRIHRAAALLALGRPRVAYVELLRALAIEPANHRGRRLLGQVFKEAGVPERAAALLTKRPDGPAAPQSDRVKAEAMGASFAGEVTTREQKVPPPPATTPTGSGGASPAALAALSRLAEASNGAPPPPLPSTRGAFDHLLPPVPNAMNAPPDPGSAGAPQGSPLPELFGSLISDLGLGATPISSTPARVEVTQVMRLRLKKQPKGGPAHELSSIEGPIVDTTQPIDLADRPSNMPPATLFDVVTSPEFHGLGFTLDDEPLFEGMFAIQPVAGIDNSETISDDTVNDEVNDFDVEQLRMAMEAKRAGETGASPARPAQKQPPYAPFLPTEPAPAPPPPRVENKDRAAGSGVPNEQTSAKAPGAEAAPNLPPAPDLPYLKRFKPRAQVIKDVPDEPPAALALVPPPLEPMRIVYAVLGALLLAGYVIALVWISRSQLEIWFKPAGVTSPPAQEGTAEATPPGSSG